MTALFLLNLQWERSIFLRIELSLKVVRNGVKRICKINSNWTCLKGKSSLCVALNGTYRARSRRLCIFYKNLIRIFHLRIVIQQSIDVRWLQTRPLTELMEIYDVAIINKLWHISTLLNSRLNLISEKRNVEWHVVKNYVIHRSFRRKIKLSFLTVFRHGNGINKFFFKQHSVEYRIPFLTRFWYNSMSGL